MIAATVIEQFRSAIEAAGIRPPEEILADSALHRFPTNGRRDDDSGWYIIHGDGIPAGAFGCWRTGVSETWCARNLSQMSEGERAEHRRRVAALQRQREEEERQRRAEASESAQRIWQAARPVPSEHPYLVRKCVQPHGLRMHDDGRLIVPMRDVDGTLCSLQAIGPDGVKRFLPGGRVAGCFHLIGETQEVFCIAEGFATAASIHEATGYPVAIAFSAGNLLPVAGAFRVKHPDAKLVLCGDHDEHGVGQQKATEAAEAVGGVAVVPEQVGDWNDVACQHGLTAVERGITAVLYPGAALLDDVHAFLGRFIAYPSEHAHVAHALWIVHAHLMDTWESTPRLAFLSPEPGSGKTRALELTETLVPRPIEAINVTPAYLFRKVSDPAGLPTILHDEIDALFNPRSKKDYEEIRAIINAGHRRGAMAGRCVMKGKTIETEELPAYCAVALAGLGDLPDTILTRSVVVRMRRRAPNEPVEPYQRRIHAPEGYRLRDRLAAWAVEVRPTLNPCPTMPAGITDRPADVWEPLLAVAEAAGGDWPERARVTAVTLVTDAIGKTPSLGVLLLNDVRRVFEDRDALATVDLLTALSALEESPWGDLKGKALDARRLAKLLKPYGVASKLIRFGGTVLRGYERAAFEDAWTRYLPPSVTDVTDRE